MDEDVRLSMEQGHQKWLVRWSAFGGVAFLLTVGFWIHDCNRAEVSKRCSEAVINTTAWSGSTIQCPDARQTLTYPTGWTWVKCSCPETEKPAPANSR